MLTLFEKMALFAVQTLLRLFWFAILFIVISGLAWGKAK